MTDPLKRRAFIRSVSFAGAALAVGNAASSGFFHPHIPSAEIKNNWFTVSFDRVKGIIQINRNDGSSLIAQATVQANLADIQEGKENKIISISSTGFRHVTGSVAFNDIIGPGKKLMISSKDPAKKLDIEIQLSLYDNLEAVIIETICRNVSGKNILVHSIEPIRVIGDEGGIFYAQDIAKCITNGEMYFDTGMLHEFGNRDNGITSGNLKGVKLANGAISSRNETIHSWWNACLFSGYSKESISIGYLENDSCLGNILLSKTANNEISFLAESVYSPALVLKPGKTISSNRLMINLANDPYTALETYADMVGRINHARTHSVINGWCSWFYTLSQVSEEEVIAETAFVSAHLKSYGLEYIQIDEGYQQWHGEWDGNKRFPHGMKWLADQIKAYGLKAGLWISPYVISEPAEVFQKHPEWLLKNADGTLKRIGNWEEGSPPPADENPKRYCLDITHPGAAQWLHDLIDRIVNDWGYEMIKIDFMAWSILAADHYYEPTLSSAQVYRLGLDIMRKAAGDKCHILECGPGAVTTGLIDSMRIEADVNYGFASAAWDTYFLHEASSMSAAARRYYFHNRTWVNDADHICMELLNNQQAEAAATIIALSGGNMISGDRLRQLDPYKLEVLKKITPSFGQAARPVDLFDSNQPSVFAIKIKKTFAEWTVAAFFNASLVSATTKKYSLQRLWLDPAKTYLVFDFWKQQFVGEVTGEINVTVEPGSVTLFTLHEKSGKPQFISTDRHVMQGAIEIEDISWNNNSKTISGTSTGPLHSSHHISIYVPEPHPWTWNGSAFFRDYDRYSIKLTDSHIIRVRVNFETTNHVQWMVKPDEFL